MKIGIVMPLAEQHGGAELMLMHLLREARRSSSALYSLVFFDAGPMEAEARALGFPTRTLDAGRLRQPIRYAKTVAALSAWMRSERLDAALSWMAKAHLYVSPAALIAGVPAFWFQHGLPDRHWMDRFTSALPAKRILACSEAAKAAQHRLTPHREISVVYPAVDLGQLSQTLQKDRRALRTKLGLPQDAMIVGIAARLQRWKGIHLVIEAMGALKERFPAAILVIVGGKHALEADYEEWLHKFAADCGVEDRVIFAGFQQNAAEWMFAMDIVVNASANEPFGMSLVEAMALGRAVVAVRAGGPAEIVSHGENGLLIEGNRSEEIADALATLMSDPELCSRLGLGARKRAREFGTDRLASALPMLLENSVKRSHSGMKVTASEPQL